MLLLTLSPLTFLWTDTAPATLAVSSIASMSGLDLLPSYSSPGVHQSSSQNAAGLLLFGRSISGMPYARSFT